MPVRTKPDEPQSEILRTKGLDSFKSKAIATGLAAAIGVTSVSGAYVHAADQVRADRQAGHVSLLRPDVDPPPSGAIKGQDWNEELYDWLAAFSWKRQPTTWIVPDGEDLPEDGAEYKRLVQQASWKWLNKKRMSNESRKATGFININHVTGCYTPTVLTEGWEYCRRPPTLEMMFANTKHPKWQVFSNGWQKDRRYQGVSRPHFTEYMNDRYVPSLGTKSDVAKCKANQGPWRPLSTLVSAEERIKNGVSYSPITMLPTDKNYHPDTATYATRWLDFNNNLPRVYHLDGRPLEVEFSTRASYSITDFKSEYQEYVYTEWLRAHQHNYDGYDEEGLGQWLSERASPEQLNNRQLKHPAYTTESGEGRQLLPWQKTAAVYLSWFNEGRHDAREYHENMYNLLIFNGIVSNSSLPAVFTQPAANDEVINSGPVEKGKELVLRDAYNIGGLFDEYTESWFQRQRLMFTLQQQLEDTYSPEAIEGISPEQLDAHVEAFMARYEVMKVQEVIASMHLPPKNVVLSGHVPPPISEKLIGKRFTETESGILLPNRVYDALHSDSYLEIYPAKAIAAWSNEAGEHSAA